MRVVDNFHQVRIKNQLLDKEEFDPASDIFTHEGINQVWHSFPTRLKQYIMNLGLGVEIEVERAVAIEGSELWTTHTDSSLRGSDAREFVTVYGTRGSHVIRALREMDAHIRHVRKRLGKTYFSFSERTSVHVHMDARMLNESELRSLVQFYLLFEDTLFQYAGPERYHNIFCAPVRGSLILGEYTSMVGYVREWEKYSALNLRAMTHHGTIEFRHMSGTEDVVRIWKWIMLISCLHYAAIMWSEKEVRDTIFELKSESMYDKLANRLFFGLARELVVDGSVVDTAASEAKLLYPQPKD